MQSSPEKSKPISRDPLARLAEQQHWITPETERSLQAAVKEVVHRVGGNELRQVLHGSWLHQPLHALLTDVPVGAWSATVAFDTAAALSKGTKFQDSMNTAADATLVLGLVGATGAAITGMNDWAEIEKPVARKIGMVHAILNVAATGLFLASGFHRLRKERSIARFLSGAGYLVLAAGAHLGGNLVYEHGEPEKPNFQIVG